MKGFLNVSICGEDVFAHLQKTPADEAYLLLNKLGKIPASIRRISLEEAKTLPTHEWGCLEINFQVPAAPRSGDMVNTTLDDAVLTWASWVCHTVVENRKRHEQLMSASKALAELSNTAILKNAPKKFKKWWQAWDKHMTALDDYCNWAYHEGSLSGSEFGPVHSATSEHANRAKTGILRKGYFSCDLSDDGYVDKLSWEVTVYTHNKPVPADKKGQVIVTCSWQTKDEGGCIDLADSVPHENRRVKAIIPEYFNEIHSN